MKLKSGFVLRDVAGECIVVPTDASLNLNNVITLNETAKTLWLALETGVDDKKELVKALLDEYDVDEATATLAVDKFVARLEELNFLA